ncbi:uncharacterized protein [Arachis hypogaea]|uniref:J domain-containing protein n=1 Tax=Arachis hypogaea TaxID=3818 RepID=A0A445DMR9_ARAHY|nr:chaperone protein dnaJ 20, chloroplastic [Arachis hypogaea]QHO59944.1 Chaperone protein DnaJ [Arachis hypogaea]RYR64436.1 hypothetical protein Ahy_A03g010540 [Arachis hypogaea]
MDAFLLSSNSKPFQCLPWLSSTKHQRHYSHIHLSCRATKVECESNFYKVLSVSPKSATMDEIKRAYRSMALQYHPDVCHDPSMKEESNRMFVQLNAAYETLSNPMLRQQYDSQLGLSVSHDYSETSLRSLWEEEQHQVVVELKTRSRRRMEQKANRMRAPTRRKDRN